MLKGTMVRPSPICRSYRAWTSLYFNSGSTHLPIGTYSIIHGHRCLVFACTLRVLPGIYKFFLIQQNIDTVESSWYIKNLLMTDLVNSEFYPPKSFLSSVTTLKIVRNAALAAARLGFWLHQTPGNRYKLFSRHELSEWHMKQPAAWITIAADNMTTLEAITAYSIFDTYYVSPIFFFFCVSFIHRFFY